ncbi:unnamed protein product [Soboliphyme baturini]|uniref:Nucleoporin_C domain-containing protein n=1 Tax=Soboliphyme baturini TaxID=241478 RepID=A0A183J474_9BILA|nr:unnamed protein product [Soboliphyme baturini]
MCPTLFTSGDAAAAKASELLQSLSDVDNAVRRNQILAQAVELYCSAADHLNLPLVCLRLEQMHYYSGIIDLALTAAAKIDPFNLGSQYLADPENKGQIPEIRNMYSRRTSCYKCITDLFDRVVSTPASDLPVLRSDSPNEQLESLVRKCLASKDELCHTAVFDWMMERSFSEQILKCITLATLQVNSPFVEQYLYRKIHAHPLANERYMDLLWKLFEKNRQCMSAAQLLIVLAEKESTRIGLEQRILYLSRAIICAKSQPDGSIEQNELLQEAQDKFDVTAYFPFDNRKV